MTHSCATVVYISSQARGFYLSMHLISLPINRDEQTFFSLQFSQPCSECWSIQSSTVNKAYCCSCPPRKVVPDLPIKPTFTLRIHIRKTIPRWRSYLVVAWAFEQSKYFTHRLPKSCCHHRP